MKDYFKKLYTTVVRVFYELSVKLHIWRLNKRLEKMHQKKLEELQKAEK